ncbi:pPIWI_RE module domain-containing protein [Streptomyces aidingensis]|uniref:DUF3893 domain-containing protein n=1 Tax=Streptomyces aidingensis TaxID=910347 RepID=A0A1I1MBG4_9ACTN|nr:DUF3962 domain-containing protein [Streptomyces aidingensis]SFC82777.1 protein of unknown function [Streptomyces aidingensis]
MTHDRIQPAAYVPNPEAGTLSAFYHGLAFPSAWREPLLRLYRHGKSAKSEGRHQQVPISRLNRLIAAVAPDLISVASKAPLDGGRPWLYTTAPYPASVMKTFLHAWLRDMQPAPEAHSLVKETAQALDIDSLKWELLSVNLLEQGLSEEGRTALPAPHLFRLLPETLAARIAQHPPYEHYGQKLEFRQVAGVPGDNGATLVSWPPLKYPDRGKTWRYSAYLRVSLRTVPFDPVPRIHLSTGISRWVREKVWLPFRSSASVYLLADESMLADAPAPTRFAVASLTWRQETGPQWAQGGPEGMLRRISVEDDFPRPERLVKEPEHWLVQPDGITAAVLHHTRMGAHGVGAGLMPTERRRLTEWAAEALQPDFVPVGELRRSIFLRKHDPLPRLEEKLSERKSKKADKDATEEERGEIERQNAEIAAYNAEVGEQNAVIEQRNGDRRRQLLAGVMGSELSVLALHQTDTMRDLLLVKAEAYLGLAPFRTKSGPGTWAWEAPELTLRMHIFPLGRLGAPLGNGTIPRRGAEWDAVVAGRRREVAAFLTARVKETGRAPQLVFVELEDWRKKQVGKKTPPPTTDPKSAIRLGCADAGLVSQFLGLPDDVAAPGKDTSAHRAKAAWADGIRQLGVRVTRPHSVPSGMIPEQLNQLAFWLVKRRVSGHNPHAQFTPIAVLLRPGQQQVMGRSPQTGGWVPYPELLKGLVGQVRGDDLKYRDQQERLTAIFVRQILGSFRGEPTLVLTHAQNIRERWPSLQNGKVRPDTVQLGGDSPKRLASLGKKLRLVRVADAARDETAQWWSPVSRKRNGNTEALAGFAQGLWLPHNAEPGGRNFYSVGEKPGTNTLHRELSKLTEHRDANGKSLLRPSASASQPDLLEVALVGLQENDRPEPWAMFVHQQRITDDYTDPLALPLVLHLARLTRDYAEPYEAPEAPGEAQQSADEGEQLAFDFGIEDSDGE